MKTSRAAPTPRVPWRAVRADLHRAPAAGACTHRTPHVAGGARGPSCGGATRQHLLAGLGRRRGRGGNFRSPSSLLAHATLSAWVALEGKHKVGRVHSPAYSAFVESGVDPPYGRRICGQPSRRLDRRGT